MGAVVLVGLTYLHSDGTFDRREEVHGQVVKVDRVFGIELDLSGQRGGEIFRLPPDPRMLERAPPGSYRLRSTGEMVHDPDYLAQFTITEPEVDTSH